MNGPNQTEARTFRFGVFEVDLAARELRKRGVRVKLQDQPFRVLETLLEKPGAIVTREELKERLWAQDEFVEFDKSLNTAVQKIRQALGDSAGAPRFLETLPKVGYRFVASTSYQDQGEPDPREEADERNGARSQRVTLLASGVGLFSLGALLGSWIAGPDNGSGEATLRRFAVPVEMAIQIPPAPSPDGRMIAWMKTPNGRAKESDVMVWDASSGTSRVISEGEGAPFWSPDSRFLGIAGRSGVTVIDVQSGNDRIVTSWPGRPTWRSHGASWSPDGQRIAFAAGRSFQQLRIYWAPAQGGGQELLFEPSEGDPDFESSFIDPYYLPDYEGRSSILYAQGIPADADIGVVDLNSGRRRIIVSSDRPLRRPVYSDTGHVLYQEGAGWAPGAGERVWAAPFSLKELELTGEPFVVAERARWPGVSADGMLTYQSVGPLSGQKLIWRDRAGRKISVIGQPQDGITTPSLSPDETEVAVAGIENGVSDIWVHETSRQVKRRITFDDEFQGRPVWGPSGNEIYFTHHVEGHTEIHVAPSSGSGSPQLFFNPAGNVYVFDWSRDGEYLVGSGPGDILYLHRASDSHEWRQTLLTDDRYDQVGPDLSPDSQWVAYQSDETGQPEIWVSRFPSGEGKQLISINGGAQPRWKGDGSELFYVRGDSMMVVSVSFGPELRFGTPQRLFGGAPQGRGQHYDVTADGARFVMTEDLAPPVSTTLQVALNWYEEFREPNDAR